MRLTISLGFAQVTIVANNLSDGTRAKIERRFSGYLVDRPEQDEVPNVELNWIECDDRPEGARRIQRDDFIMWLSEDLAQGWLAPSGHIEPDIAIDRAARLAFAALLPRHNSLLMHASAVRACGSAVLFAGESGAGKSTVVRACQPELVMSDDTVAVRRIGPAAWQAISTPFSNFSTPNWGLCNVRLASMLVLRKSAANHLGAIGASRRLAAVFSNILSAPGIGSERTAMLQLAEWFSNEVPVAEFCFTQNPPMERVIAAATQVNFQPMRLL